MSDINIPGEVQFEFPQRVVAAVGQFIPASRLTDQEIHAGEQTGDIVPWRYDVDGQLWYRRVTGAAASLPAIHGVPSEGTDA